MAGVTIMGGTFVIVVSAVTAGYQHAGLADLTLCTRIVRKYIVKKLILSFQLQNTIPNVHPIHPIKLSIQSLNKSIRSI